MLDKIRQVLAGKKTYLVGIVTIIGVLITWVETGELNWNLLMTTILAMTLRAGIAKK